MDTVQIVMLIKSTNKRVGKGIENDPVRIVTQYWDPFTGELVFEIDPEKQEKAE
jgi:hypothetical protein